MYDDFWAGFNYMAMKDKKVPLKQVQNVHAVQQQKEAQEKLMGTYNTKKFIRMRSPLGEQGEIYANGKMYIVLASGQGKVRTFGSRPFGIKYMQEKGWVLA